MTITCITTVRTPVPQGLHKYVAKNVCEKTTIRIFRLKYNKVNIFQGFQLQVHKYSTLKLQVFVETMRRVFLSKT